MEYKKFCSLTGFGWVVYIFTHRKEIYTYKYETHIQYIFNDTFFFFLITYDELGSWVGAPLLSWQQPTSHEGGSFHSSLESKYSLN